MKYIHQAQAVIIYKTRAKTTRPNIAALGSASKRTEVAAFACAVSLEKERAVSTGFHWVLIGEVGYMANPVVIGVAVADVSEAAIDAQVPVRTTELVNVTPC